MKRLRRFLILLAALTAIEWFREAGQRDRIDLRVFDANAVAQLDTEMWRSYYERRPVRLFRQMITLLETQYRMPPLRAVLNAYRAAHAAFVFKDSSTRVGYEKALPDLQAYYVDLSAMAARPFDGSRAARLELEWWIVHRENPGELPAALAALESEVYGLPRAKFSEHARLRAAAMLLRDRKAATVTEADWARIGEMLNGSWISLHDAVKAW